MNNAHNDIAADCARLTARHLEEDAKRGTEGEREILSGVLSLTEFKNGKIEAVLTLGGPHAELVLGDGPPRVEVWWGGKHATELVKLNKRFVARFLRAFTEFQATQPYQAPHLRA